MGAFGIFLFVLSLSALLKGADWLIESAEKIGLKMGLSSFIVGALIVGLGTSLPELSTSIVAVWEGETTIVTANVVGSNIANVLLVLGIPVVFARRLVMTKNLLELDLPIFTASTLIFLAVALDGTINPAESVFLLLTYGVYFLYTIFHREGDEEESPEEAWRYLPSILRGKLQVLVSHFSESDGSVKVGFIDVAKLFVGAALLAFGARYLIMSLLSVSDFFHVAPSIVSITAVAIGTSLPELLVSLKAVNRGHSDMAMGNVFGSNIFNSLLVVGIPGLISPLILDTQTLLVGLPFMVGTTFLLVLSGMSQKIYAWEGVLFLIIYGLFVAKLFVLL